MGQSLNQRLATETSEIVGRLAAGVGQIQEAGDELHQVVIGEANY
jgi:hypothetical protein